MQRVHPLRSSSEAVKQRPYVVFPSAVHLLGTTMVSIEGFSIFLSIPPSSSSSGPNSIGKGKC